MVHPVRSTAVHGRALAMGPPVRMAASWSLPASLDSAGPPTPETLAKPVHTSSTQRPVACGHHDVRSSADVRRARHATAGRSNGGPHDRR